jgi:hypothetical protein
MISCNFNSSTDTAISYFITHYLELLILTLLDVTFSLEMDKVGTLFGLFFCMTTNFNKRFYDPFKSIDIIIPYDQATRSSTDVSTSVTSEVMFLVSFEKDFMYVKLKISVPICNTSLERIQNTCHRSIVLKTENGLYLRQLCKPDFYGL